MGHMSCIYSWRLDLDLDEHWPVDFLQLDQTGKFSYDYRQRELSVDKSLECS